MEETVRIVGPSKHEWSWPVSEVKARLMVECRVPGHVALSRWTWTPQLVEDIRAMRDEGLLGLNDLISPEKAAEAPEAFIQDLEAWERSATHFDISVY